MKDCKALIIGGSAGSLEVLLKVLPDLKVDLNFPIIVVMHRKAGNENLLTDLFRARTKLKVKEIEEKLKLEPSVIYIAPPDYHLLLEKNKSFSLDASEKVNFSRPSIDVTFESAAEIYTTTLVCLLLSGANSDGTLGLQKVHKKGGLTLVQDPLSAVVPFMPKHALDNAEIDEVLDPEAMANYINKLSS